MAPLVGAGLLAFGNLLVFAADAGSQLPEIGQIANLSAVGVLGWWVWSQQKELREIRAANAAIFDRLCDRWDRWEQIRHTDSEKLEGTLRDLAANCVNHRVRVAQEGKPS